MYQRASYIVGTFKIYYSLPSVLNLFTAGLKIPDQLGTLLALNKTKALGWHRPNTSGYMGSELSEGEIDHCICFVVLGREN